MAINRRGFIKGSYMAASAILVPWQILASEKQQKLPAIGFISGIVSNFLKEDWKGTLTTLSKMGYTEMEGGWNLGTSPKEMASFCKSIGIKPFAAGLSLAPLVNETEGQIEKALSYGNEFLICYWPWLDGATNITADQCLESAEHLNRIGEKCKSAGLKFCWHNHDKEFLKDTGKGLPFDLLMKNTDPTLVSVELDLYWVKKGNADPLEVLKKYPYRYPILHVKDMNNETERTFACPGSGIIDFVPLFREALAQGVKHYIVEKDGETDGINCLKAGANYLKKLKM